MMIRTGAKPGQLLQLHYLIKKMMDKERRTIIIADDDIDYLDQLKFQVESFGFDTIAFSSERECEDAMKFIKPDLAIFDLMMENDDSGFILSYKLKKLYPDVPIMIVTSAESVTGISFESESETERNWIKADRYLAKGIRPDQLHREINKLLKDLKKMETLALLIVDDEKGIRTGIHRALEKFRVSFPFFDDDFDFHIIDAETGEEAIELLGKRNIDIVLLDNKLPGIQGIEVLEYINNNSMDSAVMMITSYASIDLAISATNNGAFNFIPKPFSAQDLKSAIESITKHIFLKRMTAKMKEEAKQVRFKFLSVLSHELKSPINAIEGYLRIMKERQAGDDIGAYEKMIDRSLTRLDSMRGLIIDMLDFTRIESGKKNRNIKEVDITALAQMAIDSILPVAIQMNINVKSDLPENFLYMADPGELEIILNNLLSNAVKYNRKNGEVIITVTHNSDNLIIEVKDTGIGMSEEDQSILFKEFTRIKTDKTKNISGSGLGLSIMKRIIDLNRGTVDVESKPDVGSVFTVKLPLSG